MQLGAKGREGPIRIAQFIAILQAGVKVHHIPEPSVIVMDQFDMNLPIPLIFCEDWEVSSHQYYVPLLICFFCLSRVWTIS